MILRIREIQIIAFGLEWPGMLTDLKNEKTVLIPNGISPVYSGNYSLIY
jgi:hypothetical protein